MKVPSAWRMDLPDKTEDSIPSDPPGGCEPSLSADGGGGSLVDVVRGVILNGQIMDSIEANRLGLYALARALDERLDVMNKKEGANSRAIVFAGISVQDLVARVEALEKQAKRGSG